MLTGKVICLAFAAGLANFTCVFAKDRVKME